MWFMMVLDFDCSQSTDGCVSLRTKKCKAEALISSYAVSCSGSIHASRLCDLWMCDVCSLLVPSEEYGFAQSADACFDHFHHHLLTIVSILSGGMDDAHSQLYGAVVWSLEPRDRESLPSACAFDTSRRLVSALLRILRPSFSKVESLLCSNSPNGAPLFTRWISVDSC